MSPPRKLFVALASLLTLTVAPAAMGCSCVAIDPAAAYRGSGLIVLVRVTALETSPPRGPWNVTLLAIKTWKGSVKPGATVQVRTPGPEGPCGFFIHTGDEFLVYSDDPNKLTGFAMCNTAQGSQVAKQVEKLDALSHAP